MHESFLCRWGSSVTMVLPKKGSVCVIEREHSLLVMVSGGGDHIIWTERERERERQCVLVVCDRERKFPLVMVTGGGDHIIWTQREKEREMQCV